jgi:hypothetical protein
MRWTDVRRSHPDEWLVIEALEAHTAEHRRIFDRIAVVEVCPDGVTAQHRYRELRREHPERELYFVHTANADLEIEERPWLGIRLHAAAHPSR